MVEGTRRFMIGMSCDLEPSPAPSGPEREPHARASDGSNLPSAQVWPLQTGVSTPLTALFPMLQPVRARVCAYGAV